MNTPKRYHPVLVTLHWLVALLVFTDLCIGYFYIRPIIMSGHGGVPGTDLILKIHMAAGVAILVLLMIRFIIRLTTRKPAPADCRLQSAQCSSQSGSLFFVFIRVRNHRGRLDFFLAGQSFPGGFSRRNEQRTWRRISTSRLWAHPVLFPAELGTARSGTSISRRTRLSCTPDFVQGPVVAAASAC